jgi:hypothetical protein
MGDHRSHPLEQSLIAMSFLARSEMPASSTPLCHVNSLLLSLEELLLLAFEF